MQKHILVVDDEKDILEIVEFNLKKQGYQVSTASNGAKGLDAIYKKKPDLVVLDLMIPDLSGSDICKIVRQDPDLKHILILMLTARSEEKDKLRGFELGADDYLTKPFSPKELTARVSAILKRSRLKEEEETFSLGVLSIDFARHEVQVGKNQVQLTAKEFSLLRTLIGASGRVLSREYLLEKVWGYEYIGETRTVDVHVRRLRQKLAAAAKYVQTIKGVGYKFLNEK